MFFDKVTTNQMTAYLQKFGWPKFRITEDTPGVSKIFTGWTDQKEVFQLAITVNRQQSIVMFVVPDIAHAKREEKSPKELADILMALGFANFATVLGRFAYDLRDGELRYECAHPVHANKLTYEQFEFILNSTVATVQYWGPRLRNVCGGDRTGEEIVKSFLEHIEHFRG